MPKKAARRGGKKHRKHGRATRKPGAARQYKRTYDNKLRRVNRERAKAGAPPLKTLPGYDSQYKRMEAP